MDRQAPDRSLSPSPGTTAARGCPVPYVGRGLGRVRISGALREFLQDVRNVPGDG
jgi:hypothetical protein